MSIIFYHNDEQKRLAIETKTQLESLLGKRVYTEIVPASEFYPAEAYHQKYYLRQVPELVNEFKAIYPDEADFRDSTAVARVNGYLGGYGTPEALADELDGLGLSPAAGERLRTIVSN